MNHLLKTFAYSLTVIGLSLSLATCPAHAAKKAGKGPIVTIDTSLGKIEVQLNETKAPISVKNFLSYVKEKAYDGTIFHRVIPGFMIQGGGMTADMAEKPTHPAIKNESTNGLLNKEGTIAMARTMDPNSATAQFFINVADNVFLDYKSEAQPGYAVFGSVITGLDVVHKIEHVATTTKLPHENVPVDAVLIKSIRLKK